MEKIRQLLTQRVATQLGRDFELIDKIVSFQFADANKAVHTHKEVEICGFGKFLLSRSKLNKKIKRMNLLKERMENKKENFKDYDARILQLEGLIGFLKEKEDEFQRKTDNGRVEERLDSPQGIEGNN